MAMQALSPSAERPSPDMMDSNGGPRERPILGVANWGTVQGRVARHHGLDANDVVGVDGLLELPDLREGGDVSLELRPAREPIETRDLELRIGDRRRRAGLEQIF